MKKKISVLAAVLLAIGLTACGNDETQATHDAAQTVQAESSEEVKTTDNTEEEYGSVLRRQKSTLKDGEIFEQENYYYFCDVEDRVVGQDLDVYEDEAGFELRIVNIDEAIATNEAYSSADYFNEIMIKRDKRMLEMVKQELQ